MDLHSGGRRRGDEERGKRTCVRKVNLFGAWVIWLKNHCVHLICSSEAGVWSREIVVGQGPNHHCKEVLKPTKVAIKELQDFGDIGRHAQTDYVPAVLSSVCIWRWEIVSLKNKREGGVKMLPVTTASKVQVSLLFLLTFSPSDLSVYRWRLHWFYQSWTFFCLWRAVLKSPPRGYILVPSTASLTHHLEHNPTGHKKELTFRNTGFFVLCALPWEMRKKTGHG